MDEIAHARKLKEAAAAKNALTRAGGKNSNNNNSGGGGKNGHQKNLKLFMHPPSIPTRFQTFHFDDHEPKGFNSTASRFDQRLDELPGPGYYKKEKLAFNMLDETSVSKRDQRFQKPPTDSETAILKVSPADYNTTKEPQYSYSMAHSVSSSFRQKIALDPSNFFSPRDIPSPPLVDPVTPLSPGAAAAAAAAAAAGAHMGRPTSSYRRMFGRNEAPGPGTYNLHRSPVQKSMVQESGASFVFKSKTRRSDINSSESTPGRHAPPPGAYEVTEKANPRAGANAAFKATARPDILSKSRLQVPGPGSYDLNNPHLRPSRSIPLRFKSVVQTIPDPASMRAPSPPGPGHYQIARAADRIHPSVNAATSIFVSATKRFESGVENKMNPGPGE
ncbi:hypothetical protein BC829DRAFT_395677 [Chytridium lagenaria]|nr:hypothetical protein BC829DRAFT_395677 [Chytridium lagenaria]